MRLLGWNRHKGLFKVDRMPFGIKTAASIFQKNMEQLFKAMKGVVAFLDDILVSGKDDEEHLKNLKRVFEKLRESGLTVKKEKCKFFEDQVEYLGHIIDKNGLRKVKNKVERL